MSLFILCVLVGVLAHHAALLLTGYLAVSHNQFEDFVDDVLNVVYIGLATVMGSYLLLGSTSVLLTTFATVLFFTISRVDLEATHELMQEEDNE